ncbi:hypothetical protein KM043_016263 [Ampulex compressa]|nr:hypothetical protein KM043_016263 [Ampulex compressa]
MPHILEKGRRPRVGRRRDRCGEWKNEGVVRVEEGGKEGVSSREKRTGHEGVRKRIATPQGKTRRLKYKDKQRQPSGRQGRARGQKGARKSERETVNGPRGKWWCTGVSEGRRNQGEKRERQDGVIEVKIKSEAERKKDEKARIMDIT